MNLSALFIRRPVATSLLAIAILLAGTLAFFRLPVAPLPNIAFPVIVVQANVTGALSNAAVSASTPVSGVDVNPANNSLTQFVTTVG